MVRSSASTAGRSKRFVNPRKASAVSKCFMIGALLPASDAHHGPKPFRRGESRQAKCRTLTPWTGCGISPQLLLSAATIALLTGFCALGCMTLDAARGYFGTGYMVARKVQRSLLL